MKKEKSQEYVLRVTWAIKAASLFLKLFISFLKLRKFHCFGTAAHFKYNF